jgi:peptidoglycan hydrolase-like protein with peptidoglycan-binding domain
MPTKTKKPLKKKPAPIASKISPLSLSRPINNRLAVLIISVVILVGVIAVGLSGASSKSNPYFAACSKANPSGLPTLKAGDKGPCVQSAQYAMEYFGVKITGTYDTKTLQVVNFLQGLQKVPVSGQINPVMWAYLFGNPFSAKCRYPYPLITPTSHNTGDCVSFLQWQIMDNGYTKGIVINGKYDTATQAAASLVQDSSTPATTVDSATWVALLDYQKQYTAPKIVPAPIATPSPGAVTLTPDQIKYIQSVAAQHPALSFGANGSSVTDVQNRLCIATDGIFGNQTLAAVKTFQARNGLAVTGSVDSDTWGKLLAVGTQCQNVASVSSFNPAANNGGTIIGGSGGSGCICGGNGMLSRPIAAPVGSPFKPSGTFIGFNGFGFNLPNIDWNAILHPAPPTPKPLPLCTSTEELHWLQEGHTGDHACFQPQSGDVKPQ